MLVLTLRAGREIKLYIPGDHPDEDREITIMLVDSSRREARIGITAPDEIDIERVRVPGREEEPK